MKVVDIYVHIIFHWLMLVNVNFLKNEYGFRDKSRSLKNDFYPPLDSHKKYIKQLSLRIECIMYASFLGVLGRIFRCL